MAITIEPMVNLGGADVEVLADGWTVVTRDRCLSAQFEHTLVVTRRGCEVTTVFPLREAQRCSETTVAPE
jgi:methionyl aminopeptidase